MITFVDAEISRRLLQLNARLNLKLRHNEYLAIVMQRRGTASGFMRSTDPQAAILGALELTEFRATSAQNARQHP